MQFAQNISLQLTDNLIEIFANSISLLNNFFLYHEKEYKAVWNFNIKKCFWRFFAAFFCDNRKTNSLKKGYIKECISNFYGVNQRDLPREITISLSDIYLHHLNKTNKHNDL